MNRPVVLSLLAGVLVGAIAGWAGHAVQAENDLRSVLVARDLERATFAVNTLNMQVTRPDAAGTLQILILRSALENLEELTREEVDLLVSPTSLRQGLDRVVVYARANGMPDLEAKASTVSRRLFGGA